MVVRSGAFAASAAVTLVCFQIDSLTRVIEDPAVKKAGGELNLKLVELELKLLELRATGRGGEASKLLSKIVYLATEVASADFGPTDQQVQLQKLLEERVRIYQRQLAKICGTDVAAFNALLLKYNIPRVSTVPPRRTISGLCRKEKTGVA